MTYTVRNATIDDIKAIRRHTTENGKVDMSVVKQSEEMRCFLCDGVPLMILGIVDHPSETDEKVVALWGLFNKEINKHTKYLVKACRDMLLDRVGYTFVSYIDESVNKFKRFATFFGFEPTKYVEEFEGKLYRFYVKRN